MRERERDLSSGTGQQWLWCIGQLRVHRLIPPDTCHFPLAIGTRLLYLAKLVNSCRRFYTEDKGDIPTSEYWDGQKSQITNQILNFTRWSFADMREEICYKTGYSTGPMTCRSVKKACWNRQFLIMVVGHCICRSQDVHVHPLLHYFIVRCVHEWLLRQEGISSCIKTCFIYTQPWS